MSPHERALIQRWAEACSADNLVPELPEEVCLRAWERHGERQESLLLLARRAGSGDVLGGLLTLPYDDPLSGSGEAMIAVLYVEPEYRRRGLSRTLVAEASRRLRERGIERLTARAGHNDDALISMGERWGFVRRYEVMLRD